MDIGAFISFLVNRGFEQIEVVHDEDRIVTVRIFTYDDEFGDGKDIEHTAQTVEQAFSLVFKEIYQLEQEKARKHTEEMQRLDEIQR